MLKTQEERQRHLNLSEECIEIGGNSPRFRGLLAHHLKTTIPTGMKINLCHACNNAKCSNPKHLYWGTAGENMSDRMKIGNWKSPFDAMVEKYGVEKAKELCATGGSAGGKIGGKASKGKPTHNIKGLNQYSGV